MQNKRPVNISGISESRVAPVAAYILKSNGGQGLIIVSSATRAKRLAQDLSFFVENKIYVVPEDEGIFLKYETKSRENLYDRIKALSALTSGEKSIVIAPVGVAMKRLPPREVFSGSGFKVSLGDDINLENLKERLVSNGYERVGIIEGKGQFAIRGSIIDIFSPDSENPYRIELFDTEVDSLRSFDMDTQRSVENHKSVSVCPAEQMMGDAGLFEDASARMELEYEKYIKRLRTKAGKMRKAEDSAGALLTSGIEADTANESNAAEMLERTAEKLEERKNELSEYICNTANVQLLENYIQYFYDKTDFIWDYAGEDAAIIVDDPDRVHEAVKFREKEMAEDFTVMVERGEAIPADFGCLAGLSDFMELYKHAGIHLFTPFQKQIKGITEYEALYSVQSRPTPIFGGRLDFLETELKNYVKNAYKVTILCSSQERMQNMRDFLGRAGLENKVWLKAGTLTSGIEYPAEKLCWIPDSDIFAAGKKVGRKPKKSTHGKPISSFADLKKGDYVVHENHGIGKFLGIEQLTTLGVKKDYIKIKYSGQDMLYVPVEQMDIVQKYIGADGAAPKINKLSGGDWKVTKAKAKAAVANMAKELLELSAARQTQEGYAFGQDTEWQAEFEDSFPYVETDDQLRCISEIKKDMEKAVPMDRLLCGDVGYGKTEVAARAVFKCTADGKQAAILVPTTLLANQHYYTLKARFEKFPFKVEVLSRFRSPSQQNEIISKLERGMVDVVIGTHRLLSKDVKFKNLGLLVVDEEQRFGVQHKEAIKMLRQNVDVLTLSATPIPRTLHMSLVGIKDMSVIEQPPEERYPVQTYVMEQDEQTIAEVIERELSRDGQVYVLYNKVRGINKVAAMVAELVPEARIAVGHGQMNEHELEKVMMGFVNGETNVLVATTIIESGLDIPNVNTIVILEADKLGLSQLYQIRGRVGRSNRMAYAYLMYKKDMVLNETAEKRLRAIKEFTEFGAGFKIAMRDLEIRGAGNVLGTEQHGHMMNIGYELYCKLVDDAVRALNGEIVNPDREETSVEIRVEAYIPDRYISDEVLKLQMYKKISAIASEEEEDEIIDEMIDRFGDVPNQTLNLTKISRIKSLAEKLCITRIAEEVNGRTVRMVFYFAEKNPLKPENLANLIQLLGPRILIHGGVKTFVRYTVEKDKLKEALKVLSVMAGE